MPVAAQCGRAPHIRTKSKPVAALPSLPLIEPYRHWERGRTARDPPIVDQHQRPRKNRKSKPKHTQSRRARHCSQQQQGHAEQRGIEGPSNNHICRCNRTKAGSRHRPSPFHRNHHQHAERDQYGCVRHPTCGHQPHAGRTRHQQRSRCSESLTPRTRSNAKYQPWQHTHKHGIHERRQPYCFPDRQHDRPAPRKWTETGTRRVPKRQHPHRLIVGLRPETFAVGEQLCLKRIGDFIGHMRHPLERDQSHPSRHQNCTHARDPYDGGCTGNLRGVVDWIVHCAVSLTKLGHLRK